MQQVFWVLAANDDGETIFYQDTQFGCTNDMLLAEQYKTKEKAEKSLNYFRSKGFWKVKKVVMTLED